MSDALVELYEINLEPYLVETRRYHPYTEEALEFNGNIYSRLPVKIQSFEDSSTGFPSPQIVLGNANGSISYLIDLYDGLRGCEVTRILTYKQYLAQPAHPNHTISKSSFYVDRPSSENASQVTFDLKANMDLLNVSFPTKVITRVEFPFVGKIRA